MSDTDRHRSSANAAGRTAPDAKRAVCAITGRERSRHDLVSLEALRPAVVELIRADHPNLPDDALIDQHEVNRYRSAYVEELLRQEHGELSELDREVADSIANQDTIVANVEHEFDRRRTFGERVSDGLAAFGGSWAFLLSFAAFVAAWIGINLAQGLTGAFDPYPFILLNLVLSTVAAVQAPVIMMSQRRQEAKDRLRSLNDYRVNLKAELEIRHLHEKVDHLIIRQWQRLAEIQRIQLEIMQESRGSR